MDKGKDFSNSKNKYMDKKRKTVESKVNYLNLSQLNGGILSPINGKNKMLNQEKEKSFTNENIKLKSDFHFNKNERYNNDNISKDYNSVNSKGKIINYIMKKDKRKINTNNSNNSIVIKSKSAKKLLENSTIRRSHNNSSVFKTNSQNNINNNINGNQCIEIFLAKEILQFLEDMKNLQISICKREPNIKELKRDFERKKINLYQEALKFTKNESNNNLFDNRSYSSFFSSNSALTISTPLTNLNNNNQNVKELTDLISVLRNSLKDIKSNSKFITSQLRTEINNLNNKILKQMDSINQYEKNLINNLNSIKGIYKLLKNYSNLNSIMDSIQSQNSFSYNVNQCDNKFEWYEGEIKKIINGFENKNHFQNGNNENNNILKINEKYSNSDNKDINKLYYNIKNYCFEIIEIIKPYINEEEIENELNNDIEIKNKIEEDAIIKCLETLKKYIKTFPMKIDNFNIEKDNLEREINNLRIQCETYKIALNNTVINKMKYNNKIEEEEDNFIESENYRKLNNDLLVIQNDLLQKLEMKDIENERNQETIKELLLINKNEEINIINDNSSNYVSNEKYRYLLNLYSNEQDQLKQLKNDYLHLIQNLSNYVENGTKISLDINKISFNTNKRSTNELNFDEEQDSIELGRINENDLLTDKNSTISNKNLNIRINSRESKGSNCATFNKYINVTSNIPSSKMVNIKHITSMKLELKQSKNEIEKLNKKLTDLNDVLSTISSAISKLFQEVQYSNKGKELFNLIFKLLNYSEDTIHKMFIEKEKMKK